MRKFLFGLIIGAGGQSNKTGEACPIKQTKSAGNDYNAFNKKCAEEMPMVCKPYFKQNCQDPKPLNCAITFSPRFSELDPMNIVWHGNYAVYFEQGRLALGKKYGIGYMDFYRRGITIPLKQMHFDYMQPLEFEKTYRLETFLHWNEAARLDFEFCIYNDSGALMTRGYSVQLMIDKEKEILVNKPDFFEEICRKWKSGGLQPFL
ncbi:MAG: acyl-CoA thioesterase [Endomicrobium sp.]|nr:acyl-CoA thioesterase [Endomicrobium sp.]